MTHLIPSVHSGFDISGFVTRSVNGLVWFGLERYSWTNPNFQIVFKKKERER